MFLQPLGTSSKTNRGLLSTHTTYNIPSIMGNVESIPVVSQAKSGVQVLCGDTEGARETQKNFCDTCPVLSQGKSAYQWYCGDSEAALATQKKFGKTLSSVVDGVPAVGHVKGGIHYICGDKEGGDRVMKAASRTVGVIGGGALGGLTGGPVGAVLGGIAGGATMDTLTTGVDSAVNNEYRPSGHIATATKIYKGEARSGEIFDAVVTVAFDGIAGHSAGKAASKIKESIRTKKMPRKIPDVPKKPLKNILKELPTRKVMAPTLVAVTFGSLTDCVVTIAIQIDAFIHQHMETLKIAFFAFVLLRFAMRAFQDLPSAKNFFCLDTEEQSAMITKTKNILHVILISVLIILVIVFGLPI